MTLAPSCFGRASTPAFVATLQKIESPIKIAIRGAPQKSTYYRHDDLLTENLLTIVTRPIVSRMWVLCALYLQVSSNIERSPDAPGRGDAVVGLNVRFED